MCKINIFFTLAVRQNSCLIYILRAHFLSGHALQTNRALKSSYKQHVATSVWTKQLNEQVLHVVMKNNLILCSTNSTVSDYHKNPEIIICTLLWNWEYLCDTCKTLTF